jgi:pimeloyl-ACP methyl ester carboxylesterase
MSEVGSGPCVVLLHAFPCDGWLWEAQSAALAGAGYRVLVPDLPGFGRSPLLPVPPSLDAVADALLDSLHARGATRAVVAGSSLGGYVAMAVARHDPELVAGLGLVGTKATADAPEAADRRRLMARQVEEDPARCADLLTAAVLPGLLGPTTRAQRPQLVTRCRQWIRRVPPQTVAWYQRAMADRPDSRGSLAGLDVPVAVIHGVEDTLSPASEQELMSASLRRGRVVAVPRAGHLVSIEAADVVSRGLVDVADAVRGLRPA